MVACKRRLSCGVGVHPLMLRPRPPETMGASQRVGDGVTASAQITVDQFRQSNHAFTAGNTPPQIAPYRTSRVSAATDSRPLPVHAQRSTFRADATVQADGAGTQYGDRVGRCDPVRAPG